MLGMYNLIIHLLIHWMLTETTVIAAVIDQWGDLSETIYGPSQALVTFWTVLFFDVQ